MRLRFLFAGGIMSPNQAAQSVHVIGHQMIVDNR
jgi:hypothetical protein